MDDNKTLHVALATDDGYVKQLLVALCSIVRNTRRPLHVYVLDAGLSDGKSRYLSDACSKLNVGLTVLPVDKQFIFQFPVSSYYRQATYARLQLADLLPDLDRVLYLDPDIVVRKDLGELWDCPVDDVAALVNVDVDADFLVPIRHKLEFGSSHAYFNAGVMLLNLAFLRSMNFSAAALEFAKRYPDKISIVDQDVLNFLLKDHVRRFALKWNYSPLYCDDKSDASGEWRNLNTLCSEAEQEEAERDPAIVHYHNQIKPWHCSPVARKHPWYDEYFLHVAHFHEMIGDDQAFGGAPRISVIVPACNVAPFLNKCMDSVLSQRYGHLEVIAVDDGSKDATGTILDDYARWDRRVKVVHKSNGGLGSAYNAGLNVADGKYVAFVESDDWIHSEMFERLVAHAEEHQVEIVKCDFLLAIGNELSRFYKFEAGRIPVPCRMSDMPYIPIGHLGFWAGLYRRDFIESNEIRFLELPGGGFVDIKFFWQTHVLAKRMAIVDRPFYHYRQHAAASIAPASMAKNWPLLIENYRQTLAFLVKTGNYNVWREVALVSLFQAVRHTCSLCNEAVQAELLAAVRPLLAEFRPADSHFPLSTTDSEGILQALNGKSPVSSLAVGFLKRRFRWMVRDPHTSATVHRIRSSPLLRRRSPGVSAERGGPGLVLREIVVLLGCSLSLAVKASRALFSRGASKALR